MSPLLVLIVVCVLGGAGMFAGLLVHQRVSRKQEALFAATKGDGAILHEKCMIRDGYVECPGVAVVVNDTLILHSLLNGKRRLPLSQIRLKKETSGIGRYPWWGKRIFHLESPGISKFAIGVKHAEAWRNIFEKHAAT